MRGNAMMQYVYKATRKDTDGKRIVARVYRGRYRLPGDRVRDVSLDVSDKQTAEKRLGRIVLQAQRESVGLGISKAETECLARPLVELVGEFVGNKETIGKADKYTSLLSSRLLLLAKDCGWHFLGDINPQDFLDWRRDHKDKSAKTLNEFLFALRGFLKWIRRHYGEIAPNLDSIDPMDKRGRETFERRGLKLEELVKLWEVSPSDRRAIYQLAFFTGLRRAELEALRWADVMLDAAPPYLCLGALHTKNKQVAKIALIPLVVNILRTLRPSNAAGEDAVLPNGIPRNRDGLHKDMAKAGIPLWENGKKFDFHSFRITACTLLQAMGSAPRSVQAFLRHSDIRLTMKNYTDVLGLPVFEDVKKLGAMVMDESESSSRISSLDLVPHCHFVAYSDTRPDKEKPAQPPDFSRDCADTGLARLVEAAGVEPASAQVSHRHLHA